MPTIVGVSLGPEPGNLCADCPTIRELRQAKLISLFGVRRVQILQKRSEMMIQVLVGVNWKRGHTSLVTKNVEAPKPGRRDRGS